MPCRDYMDDYALSAGPQIEELKQRCDKLSRIACLALTHIEEMGTLEGAQILRTPEVHDWWTAHKEADRKETLRREKQLAEEREKARLEKIKKETLSKLTADQKKALGIK